MELTAAQKKELFENGYLQLAGLISQKQINVALRAINHSLGQGIKPQDIPKLRASSYCPELLGKPPITDLLFKSGLFSIAESLIGKNRLRLSGGGQIALRFPNMEKPAGYAPHIDGLYREGNRVSKGKIESFTMLGGVFLSDVPNQFWGNFAVWPGSHRLLQKHFQEYGSQSLREGLPKMKMPDPIQLTARAGDAILCHYQTVHTVVSNVSPHIRYAVFFRLAHVNHSAHREKPFTDIWMEWPGIKNL
jgi:hypothetical protein